MNQQRGFGFLHLVLIVVVLGVAAGYWKHHQRITAEERKAQEAQEKIEQVRQKKIAAERNEYQKRLAEEKQKSEFDKIVVTLDSMHAKWMEAARLAGSTSRIALAQPVATLQSIKREAEAIIVPPCLDSAKAHLVSGMGQTIEGFFKFMANDGNLGNILAASYFDAAKADFSEYEKVKSNCNL